MSSQSVYVRNALTLVSRKDKMEKEKFKLQYANVKEESKKELVKYRLKLKELKGICILVYDYHNKTYRFSRIKSFFKVKEEQAYGFVDPSLSGLIEKAVE